MTTMIGIHQKQDKVDKLYENMGLRAASLAAVGPFASKVEALAWHRITSYNVCYTKLLRISMSVSCGASGPVT